MNILKNKYFRIVSITIVVFALIVSAINVDLSDKQVVITLGYANADADYEIDGTADDVQVQAALNALPTTGGRLLIKASATGFTTLNFTATVTRAIDNVIIDGVGQNTNIAYNASDPIFTFGGDNWIVRNIKTDAGVINTNSKTGWIMENVLLGTTYYAFISADDVTADQWYIPTGRSATYKIAASNATTIEKYQADVVVDGDADDEIQVGLTAGLHTELSSGTFTIGAAMTMSADYSWLSGQGTNTSIKLEDAHNAAIVVLTISGDFCQVSDIQFNGNSGAQASGNDDGIVVSGIHNTVSRNYVHHWNHYSVRFGSTASYGLAEYNTVTNGYTGIQIFGDYSRIEKNIINNTTAVDGAASVYQCAEYQVIGNDLTDCYYGITVNQADGSRRGIIAKNTIKNTTDAGIWIDVSTENIIDSNVIHDSTYIGIRAENCTNCTISNNIIIDSGRHGIYFYGASPIGTGNLTTSNIIFRSSQGTNNTYSGIEIDCNYSEFSFNIIRQGALANKAKYGIDVVSGSTRNYIHGNDLYDSAVTNGYQNDGTETLSRDNRGNAGNVLYADS